MTDPVKVLVVITSANRRGAELEGVDLAAHLSALGTPAQVVALSPSTSAAAVDAEVIGRSPLQLATLRALRRRARQVDVVIAYGSSSLPACSIALIGTRVPFVYRSIGDPSRWIRGGVHRVRTALLFHRARRVVALWPAAAGSISRMYRVPISRIDVIPNARDHARFAPATPDQRAAARQHFGLSADAHVVAFIGALSDEKRPGLAVDAVTAVAGAHLLIAGDGPRRADAERGAVAASDRMHFLGSLADVLPVLQAADVVLSTSSTEGMPGSLIEAVLCGVPIVATDVGAVADVVAAGTGTLVPETADVAAIAAAVRQQLTSTSAAGPMADCPFTWQHVAAQWQLLIAAVAR